MRLYQYTSLESLAMILSKKQLRFTRLDKVDDMEEGNMISSGQNLSYNTFVSCWTHTKEENIALWKMYTPDSSGIRISIESSNFFESNLIKAGVPNVAYSIEKDIPSYLTNSQFYSDYVFLQFLIQPCELIPRKIIYEDDPSVYNSQIIKIKRDGFSINIPDIGIYKRKIWEFQKEVRFILTIFPYPREKAKQCNFDGARLFRHYLQHKINAPNFECFYLNISEKSLSNLEIVKSPLMSDANSILLESLLYKYAPKAQVYDSELKGKIRK